MANTTKTRNPARVAIMLTALLLVVALFIPIISGSVPAAESVIREVQNVITNREQFYDGTTIRKLPSAVKDTDTISVILRVREDALLDAYRATNTTLSFGQWANTEAAQARRAEIAAARAAILATLDEAGIAYGTGASYANVLSGFEITLKAGDFARMCGLLDDGVTPIVGEVYETADTKLDEIENAVDVYDTGIFDSSDFAYDGSGMVVAVLDTGTDYYHSAFSMANFSSTKLGMTFADVSDLLASNSLRAEGMQSGLTASDVYISDKMPYGFDYADGDSDVFPINSDHGTHVAGVILGNDDVITGVAPNAQLVTMKIFSDIEQSARTSWILAALEDCVLLGVDVINMSIGTACGFSRETDKEQISGVYDDVRAAGISMVVAASNSFNSTYGSEKNGNLGLTSNPDSATVGSPSTYAGTLSVASINGAKTPYLLFNGNIIYFLESTDRVSEEKHFLDELLPAGKDTLEIEYVTVPGVGRSADYTGLDVTGKIVLIARGQTTFEEKANVAEEKGAAGVIIYNNVSGEIKMNVGDTKIPVCSIRQDDGELMAATPSGKITVSREQACGPFMSDFSSWGPTPDLRIKPEITAHGGSILSSVPGQAYDRISGTSMATPNMSGVVALLRQYVADRFPSLATDPQKVTSLVNCLLMSTADIVYNTNGLPYAVRKQGAGLANLNAAAATNAYIITYDRVTGEEMSASKIELGDDPRKNGVYTLRFSIRNFGNAEISYDVSGYVMTEGVSDTKTNDGETTVTEQGYLLDGTMVVTRVEGGKQNGNSVSVGAGETATVTVTLTLTDEDKAYMDRSFENGMYVEGFVVLDARNEGEEDLSVPYLAFYGDWTVAPIFDLDYFETNKDELDDSIDLLDKTLPDAYATRPIGGVEEDYVSYLGAYYFQQNPSGKMIAADRKYISLSNQIGAVNALRYVWAGLLRNCERIEITITEDATGEVVYHNTETDIRKSYGDGGPIYPANVEIEFSAIENNLKNNTQYTVTLQSYLDYGDGGAKTNKNNVFTFPLTTDFEAPVITGCEFKTEYDRAAKKTRLYATMAVYDNHYAMALQIGYVDNNYVLQTFDKYLTPVYSSFNGTTYVTYELTDYIHEIRENAIDDNVAITVACYDYALNTSTFEIPLPDDYTGFYFDFDEKTEGNQTELTLNPNELYTLAPKVYPGTEWPELLDYTVYKTSVARVVNGKLLAVAPGVTRIRATDPVSGQKVDFTVRVREPGDEGYVRYDKPVTDSFTLTGYYTDFAYYYLDSTERDIGSTEDEMKFGPGYYALSMFPSEAVTLRYRLDAYFPESTTVSFDSSNEKIVTVDENGKITAVAEGFASISVRVLMDGKSTYYSQNISITVKDPYITSGPSLSHYFGNGGAVIIPNTLGVTEIGQYAFSNYHYISKTAEDEISEEEPDATKIWFRADAKHVTSVIIPEGIKTIGPYAFAGLTNLRSVILPSTIEKIDQGAFYGCTSLETIEGLENVKFINQHAFEGCGLTGTLTFKNTVAIADYAFYGCEKLSGVVLTETTQSVGAYAFAGAKSMTTLTVNAEKIKIGRGVFSGCSSLASVSINAAVIPAHAFDGCSKLASVTLGRDVAVVGEYAFRGTTVTAFTVAEGNATLYPQSGKPYILNAEGTTILLFAPGYKGTFAPDDSKITSVAAGAFAGAKNLTGVNLPYVTQVGNYAFADCALLSDVSLGKLTAVGDYAFYGTAIKSLPSLDTTVIGKYAFANSALESVTIPAGMQVGDGAFSSCKYLAAVVIGDGATLGRDAFRTESQLNWTYGYEYMGAKRIYHIIYNSPLHSLTIGNNVTVGDGAFYGAAELERVSMGTGVSLGNYAFYNAVKLRDIDLSGVTEIGDYAFTGDIQYRYTDTTFETPAVDSEGYYLYTFFTPALTEIDLSAATKIGELAFNYCRALTRVTLGEGVKEIPPAAFSNCEKLASVNLENVTVIGDEAFAYSALTEANLSAATEIGKYAFAYAEELTTLQLATATEIREGAFAYCFALRETSSMAGVTYLGDYAFAYTALTEADLSAATYIGTHAFYKDACTAKDHTSCENRFTLTLGEALTDMGDNPFAMCHVSPFTTTVTEHFNGVDYETVIDTFDLNAYIRVIDGSLYRVVPNGLEMITYTGTGENATVAEGTVRISAMAFAGADVKKVMLPSTLKAIGHKAFYACRDLMLVSFASYDAPVLEEEYDENYYLGREHIPASGTYTLQMADGTYFDVEGIGILPYFMWNATEQPCILFYGASFVDYIGYVENPILMVRPVNGQNYDSFIFNQYFSGAISGAAAADDVTLGAIAAISRLPEKTADLTLEDKDLVLAARAAYDKIASLEQRALVADLYSRLTDAEKRIEDLEFLNQNNQPTPPTEEPEEPKPATDGKLIAIILLSVFLGLSLAAAGAFAFLFFRGRAGSALTHNSEKEESNDDE